MYFASQYISLLVDGQCTDLVSTVQCCFSVNQCTVVVILLCFTVSVAVYTMLVSVKCWPVWSVIQRTLFSVELVKVSVQSSSIGAQ